jgi:hypothetical protein
MRKLSQEHMFYFEHLMNALPDSEPYSFRNLACWHEGVEIEWSICGQLLTIDGYGGGVLEWCHCEEDAKWLLSRMLKDPTIINPKVTKEELGVLKQLSGYKTKEQRRKEAVERNFRGNINDNNRTILNAEVWLAKQYQKERRSPTLKYYRSGTGYSFLDQLYSERSDLLLSVGLLDEAYNYEKCVIRMTEEEMFIEMAREIRINEDFSKQYISGQIPKKVAELEIQRRGLYKNAGLDVPYQLLSLV